VVAVLAGDAFSPHTVQVYLLAYMAATVGAFGVLTLMSSPYRGDDA